MFPSALLKEDSKTTTINNSIITAKDIALDDDLQDLCSLRGQLGNPTYKRMTNTSDFNDYTTSGVYGLYWDENTRPLNQPPFALNGVLVVYRMNDVRIKQIFYRLGTSNTNDSQIYIRSFARIDDNSDGWGDWHFPISSAHIGDGLTINNVTLSVPLMEGATATQDGTSGRVPAPLKTELGKVLGADGEWTYPSDIAINNDITDLATARGQIGDPVYNTSVKDFNDFIESGTYCLRYYTEDNIPNVPPTSINCFLDVKSRDNHSIVRQTAWRIGTVDLNNHHIWTRTGEPNNNLWSQWILMLTNKNLGDGFRISNTTSISVPEYDGASATDVATSGLVPPADAGEQNHVLCGDGSWKSFKDQGVLTKLTTNKQYYVNVATGSDTLDNGRGESASKPFKTLKAALNHAVTTHNLGLYSVFVNVAEGTYSEGDLTLPAFTTSTGSIIIRGASQSVRDTTIIHSRLILSFSNRYVFQHITIKMKDASSYYYGVNAEQGNIDLYDVTFDGRNFIPSNATSTSYLIRCTGGKVRVWASDNSDLVGIKCLVSSNAPLTGIIGLSNSGTMEIAADITVVGDITVNQFISATTGSKFSRGSSILTYPGRLAVISATGTVTGKRYSVNGNSVVATSNGGPEFFPGTIAGTTTTGGQYT